MTTLEQFHALKKQTEDRISDFINQEVSALSALPVKYELSLSAIETTCIEDDAPRYVFRVRIDARL